MAQEVEIYIDKIVLEGFEGMNAAGLQAAIQDQLATMIATHGLSQGLSDYTEYGRLNGGQISLGASSRPGEIGGGIAKGIFQGLNSNSQATIK